MITNTQIFTAALFVTAKPETTQTSTNRWMDKRTIVVYPYNGIVLNKTNE